MGQLGSAIPVGAGFNGQSLLTMNTLNNARKFPSYYLDDEAERLKRDYENITSVPPYGNEGGKLVTDINFTFTDNEE